MAKQLSRKHHTVPRFLLRRFANARDDLIRVELPGEKRHPIKVGKAAVQNGFHLLLNEDDQEVDDFERFASGLESAAADALRRMLEENHFPPSDEDRAAIATFVALQYLRTPAVREHHREMDDHLFKMNVALQGRDGAARVLRKLHSREPTEERVDAEWAYMSNPSNYRVRASASQHIDTILQLLPGTAAQFHDRSWYLARWQRKALILSDTPVVLCRQDDEPIGLATADAVLTALDRRALLCMGAIGDEDALIQGNAQLANDVNQAFVANTRHAFFHHPDDTDTTHNHPDHAAAGQTQGTDLDCTPDGQL